MAELLVVNPGLFASIQDAGRFGSRRFGVPWSGVLDPYAAQLANVLVGNPQEYALIEFFQQGPVFKLTRGSLRVAVVGDCLLILHRDQERQMCRAGRSITLVAGDSLQIGRLYAGKAGYIAIGGGLAVSAVMGSRSTYLRARFGGLDGELLQAGDSLPLAAADDAPSGPNLYLPAPAPAEEPGEVPPEERPPSDIRVILGPQDDHFTVGAKQMLLNEIYRISHDSDRMGSRLVGPHLAHDPDKGTEIISDGLVPGAIQVPGSGAPIVMLADGPTVGGYPKIATVISCDLPALATMLPGMPLRFRGVSVAEAEAALRESRATHRKLLAAIRPLPKVAEPFAVVN